MKKTKRTLSFLLISALILGLLCPIPLYFDTLAEVQAAEPRQLPGNCGVNGGSNIQWELTVDEDSDWDLTSKTPYKLILTGSGEMAKYSASNRPPWYSNRSVITSISIAKGITNIGDYAFNECASLKEITLPDSVTSVGSQAVSNCPLLETVICGTGLKSIGFCSFCRNPSLTDIQLNEGLQEISNSAFSSSGLKQITIPDSVTTLGAKSFYGTKITEITIPKNVTIIKEAAFMDCSSLQSIQVAADNPCFFAQDHTLLYEKKDGIPYQTIAYAVASPSDSVTIAEGTKRIGSNTFHKAGHLSSITFPDTLKSIGDYAFWECTGIKELDIPDSVQTIGDSAFQTCRSLTTLHIGTGLEKIPSHLFSGCSALSSITISEGNPYLEAIGNVIYNKEHTVLYFYPPARPGTRYQISDTVKELAGYAVADNAFLQELYMPKNLIKISPEGISENRNLKSLYFPGNAPTEVSSSSIRLNAGNMIIYRPSASTGWDSEVWSSFVQANWDPNNSEMDEGTISGVSWKYEGATGRISFTGPGKIPDFTQENPAPWNDYMYRIQTIETENITDIGNYSFYQAENLIRSEADGSLKRIGDYAFAGCSQQVFFTNITSIETIGTSAVETIGTSAFEGNASLKGSLILEKVSSIQAGAFKGCASITDAILGSRLTSLEDEVFSNCTKLNSFIIPESVSSVKSGAFQGCIALRTINIPANVNTIGSQAFSGGSSLEKVYFYGSMPADWAKNSFENCNGSLTLYYRKTNTDWNQLGNSWNSLPLAGLERFYTEQRDHYSFGNSDVSFGYPFNYRIPRQRYVDVLDMLLGSYWYVVEGEWKGSCYGMAASTLAFYENSEFHMQDYAPSAESLYQAAAPHNKNAELTRLIEAFQISQHNPTISDNWGDNINNYKNLIRKVEEFERSGGLNIDSMAEPIVMGISSKFNSHAVVPVSVTQTDNGDFQLKVYDPNFPLSLQTLTIYKDFSGISYGIYTEAIYIEYSAIQRCMSGVELYSDAENTSLYLSIDKEYGMVTDSEGNDISQIEGAYEQKPMADTAEDTFTGIRSFVLPEGNYRLAADIPEGQTETTNPDSVTFYTCSKDCFAEISSSDENAVLNVTETGMPDEALKLELQSDSQAEETSSVTLVNPLGMERTIETDSSKATIIIGENNEFTVQAPGQDSITLDGQELTLTDGQTTSSFVAASEENPLKASELKTEVTCDGKNRLNGTIDAEVISNASEAKEVTVTAEFFESGDTPAAVFSEKKTLNPGLNLISLSLEELETVFQKTAGDLMLSCRFTVTDENDNSAAETNEGISITLTEQGNPGSGGSSGNDGSSGSGGSSGNGGSSGSGGSSGNGGSSGSSGSSGSGGSSNSGNTKPGTDGTDTNSSGTDDSEADTPPAPPKRNRMVTDIKVNVKNLTLGVGETFSLKASVLPENASDKTLRFTASNKNITVSAGGKISARKTGSSKITITSSNGKTETVKISVKKKPSKITLNEKTKIIKAGWKFQIKVKFPKGSASHKLTYSSNRKSVATVSSTGKVTARKRGTAIITVRTYNGKKAKLKIIVKK